VFLSQFVVLIVRPYNTAQHTTPHCISDIRKLSYSASSSRNTHDTCAASISVASAERDSLPVSCCLVSPLYVCHLVFSSWSLSLSWDVGSSSDSLSKNSSRGMSFSIDLPFLFADVPKNSLEFKYYCIGHTTPRTCAVSWLVDCGCPQLLQHCGALTSPLILFLYTDQELKLFKEVYC